MIDVEIATAALQALTAEQAWHYRTLPYALAGERLGVLVADDVAEVDAVVQEISLLTGLRVDARRVPPAALATALAGAYRRGDGAAARPGPRRGADGEDFLAGVFAEAVALRASDIHLEPDERECRVRLRVDGTLIERFVVEPAHYPRLVNRVKVRANLDISQRRLPQDGRIALEEHGLDVRVATVPTLHGEKVVMRLLGMSAGDLSLDQLGMAPDQLATFRRGIERGVGIVLISGPTGSGKTTTLWGSLAELNEPDLNVMTVEDPIEYTLAGVNQVQANESIGLTFAVALRSFLRHDPNIIMVGEIRDLETAQVALRASTTGHLVLSTIHTNSAWGIVARLRDMGLPGYRLADTLNTLVAQRLLRRLCGECKRPNPEGGGDYVAGACAACHYTGYRGRVAVYEVIPVTPTLQEAMRTGEPAHDELDGYASLAQGARRAVERGETSLAEARGLLL